jgi:amino-acid N-acetyltransferase
MNVGIEPARSTDLSAMLALLAQHRLPGADLERHLATALVAREGDRLVGCAAIEVYGTAGLLRSVAVDDAQRGTGIGARLTQAALALARTRGLTMLYLLTETAAGFFPRFGFRPIARDAVPTAVRRSVEFTGACPESAAALVHEL